MSVRSVSLGGVLYAIQLLINATRNVQINARSVPSALQLALNAEVIVQDFQLVWHVRLLLNSLMTVCLKIATARLNVRVAQHLHRIAQPAQSHPADWLQTHLTEKTTCPHVTAHSTILIQASRYAPVRSLFFNENQQDS